MSRGRLKNKTDKTKQKHPPPQKKKKKKKKTPLQKKQQKTAYELLNLRALKISMLHKNHIFQCMDILCGISKDRFKSSQVFLKRPRSIISQGDRSAERANVVRVTRIPSIGF